MSHARGRRQNGTTREAKLWGGESREDEDEDEESTAILKVWQPSSVADAWPGRGRRELLLARLAVFQPTAPYGAPGSAVVAEAD